MPPMKRINKYVMKFNYKKRIMLNYNKKNIKQYKFKIMKINNPHILVMKLIYKLIN